MVEESDNSDSWGSMLINAILVKSGLISGEKSKIHSINQEHQLMGFEKSKTVKDVSNKVVDRKVVDDLKPRRNDDRSDHPEFYNWADERMGNFAKTKSSNLSTDFIKKKDDMVRNSLIHSSDIIEKQTKLVTKDEESLAPAKSSDSAPAQVCNEKSSDQCPTQTDKNLSVRSTDFIENQIDLEEKDETPLAPTKSND